MVLEIKGHNAKKSKLSTCKDTSLLLNTKLHQTQGHKRGGLTTAPLLWQCELTFRRLRSSTLQLLFARLAKHFKNVGVKT
ncbi:hypothetical protein evm_009584 [Chilo suppressalis]|nr:hypothetical protein evm_009584 [Chilo suppressalis]